MHVWLRDEEGMHALLALFWQHSHVSGVHSTKYMVSTVSSLTALTQPLPTTHNCNPIPAVTRLYVSILDTKYLLTSSNNTPCWRQKSKRYARLCIGLQRHIKNYPLIHGEWSPVKGISRPTLYAKWPSYARQPCKMQPEG